MSVQNLKAAKTPGKVHLIFQMVSAESTFLIWNSRVVWAVWLVLVVWSTGGPRPFSILIDRGRLYLLPLFRDVRSQPPVLILRVFGTHYLFKAVAGMACLNPRFICPGVSAHNRTADRGASQLQAQARETAKLRRTAASQELSQLRVRKQVRDSTGSSVERGGGGVSQQATV